MLPNEAHGRHGRTHRFPSVVVIRSRFSIQASFSLSFVVGLPVFRVLFVLTQLVISVALVLRAGFEDAGISVGMVLLVLGRR